MARARNTSPTKRSTARQAQVASPFDAIVKKAALPVAILAGVGVIAASVYFMPSRSQGSKAGVGANGFSVYEMKGVDLGIANVVNRATVIEELGTAASSVDRVEKSGAVNFNGNRGQTATYPFTLAGGGKATLYVDVMVYKNQAAYERDDVFAGTADLGTVDDLPVRAMHAATIGKEREYAILVTKDLKSYKFAITQPNDGVKIDEVAAHAILKRVADRANLLAVKE